MKKVCTLFLGLAALAVATPTVMAGDVYVKIDHNNPDISIIQGSGIFDKVNLLLGNVSNDLVVDLGEFDFDSNSFKAAYFDYANSWGGCNLLLKVGQNYESAKDLVKIPANPSNTYYLARRFGQNFGKDVDNYVAPTGKQHVYATSADGNGIGNLVAIGLVENEYTAADYYKSENYREVSYNTNTRDDDQDKRLLWPSEDKRWDNRRLELPGNSFFNVNDPEQTADPGKIDGDGSIGWTGNNLEMHTKEAVNFGSAQYNQLVVCMKLSDWARSVDLNMFLDLYLDEVKEENRIGHIWYGMEAWGGGSPYLPLVCNLEQPVSGQHTVILKWGSQGSNNVMNVAFYEGNAWAVTPIPDDSVYPTEAEPVTDAFGFNFIQGNGNSRTDVDGDGNSKIYNNDWKCTILNRGQWEDNNIGWAGDGTLYVITAPDGSEYDFGDHNYSGVIIKYGTGGGGYGLTNEDANIRLYVDLGAYGDLDWANKEEYYTSGQDIAEVRMAHTGDWNNLVSYYSEIKDPSMIQGKHKLYVAIHNKSNGDAGANVKGIYFVERTGVEGEIAEITNGFTVTFEENVDLVNADAISVKSTSETDINGLTPEVTVNKNVVTVSLADYPGGAYVVTIPEASVNVGVNYFNNVVEQEVATWDAIKAITIAHDQDGDFELSGGEEAELTLNVETVNGKAYDPETVFEVECANNAASHVSAEVKDDVVLVTVAETAVKSDSPVVITLKAGDVTSNAVELNHYAAPTTIVLGGTQDEFVEANNTITIADDSEALNYTIALNEGAYQKFLFAAEDNECASIVLTDNGLTITPKAEGTTQFSITPLKAGEFKNDSDPTTPATTYTVVVSHTVGVQIFNANGEEVEIFNLQGVKVANPQNGIFIINGKKVLVK